MTSTCTSSPAATSIASPGSAPALTCATNTSCRRSRPAGSRVAIGWSPPSGGRVDARHRRDSSPGPGAPRSVEQPSDVQRRLGAGLDEPLGAERHVEDVLGDVQHAADVGALAGVAGEGAPLLADERRDVDLQAEL